MKSACIPLGTGLALLLAGCSTTPVALAPVGPDPAVGTVMAANGQLEVFSRLTARREGNNPTWYQHTSYSIYDAQGNLLKRVNNSVGYYEEAPRLVALPAGRYVVNARAQDYLRVQVPVMIESGRTTTVHLDGNWQLPADAPKGALVSLPNGNPVGWRAEPAKEFGIN